MLKRLQNLPPSFPFPMSERLVQTPQTFNVQRVQEACVHIKQQQLTGLHCDVVAIVWHSLGKPTVRPGPPPTELEGKVALERDNLACFLYWVARLTMENVKCLSKNSSPSFPWTTNPNRGRI